LVKRDRELLRLQLFFLYISEVTTYTTDTL
jgi:hypothetical protein